MAKEQMAATLDLRGLDLVTPVDLIKNGHTPYAKNFRLYAQQSDDRRVAVSSRKGPGFYINPLSETLVSSNTATTGASTQQVGVLSGMHAVTFTAASNDRLTRFDLNVSNTMQGAGPIIVQVWSNNSGTPGKLLTESSLLSVGGTASYITARFVNAIKLQSGLMYWIVIRIQDDGDNTYTLSTTTSGTKAYKSDSTLSQLTLQTYALNYRIYTTPDVKTKGSYRFTRDNGLNITLVAIGTQMYKVDETTHALVSIATGLNASATEYSFTNGDNKVFWVNGYDQLKAWNGTTVETITDTELPILSQVVMHKDRLWGVVASDPNKVVFSENPGNPAFDPTGTIPTTPTEQWYYAWLSVSFYYVPRPHNGSPITSLTSFQDALTITTQDNKYVLSGYDRGSLNLRQATGAKGAISSRGVIAEENYIWFVGDDGFYQYNGSKDTKISDLINPLFAGCGQKDEITPVLWKNEVRFYMASEGSSVNDTCIVYNKDLQEMQYDTDTFVDYALYYNDADDRGQLIEISSIVAAAYEAEVDYNALGAPIDFEYRFKYDSMGTPAQKKRIRRYFPILQGTDSSFAIQLAMDKDFEDSPRTQNVIMTTNNHKLGEFILGIDTLGGDTSFKVKRMATSGYAYYWQLRVIRRGVNNRVAFIGAQYSYKTKRL